MKPRRYIKMGLPTELIKAILKVAEAEGYEPVFVLSWADTW